MMPRMSGSFVVGWMILDDTLVGGESVGGDDDDKLRSPVGK